MITITFLTDKRLINANFSLVVADLDYTFTDFGKGHIKGVKNLEKILGKEIALEVDKIFHLIHEEHTLVNKNNWNKKQQFDQIISNLKSLNLVSNQYGFRKYSREMFIIIAAKRLGIKITKNDVEAGRDAYWQGIADYSIVYSDAGVFLNDIKRKNIPLIIMTGSDSIMKVYEDLSLEYDPEFSRKYKEKRVKKLDFKYQRLIIGDPIDKPDPVFFDQVEDEIKKLGKFKKEEIIFLGDSYNADLKVPEERGYRTYLIKR